MQRTIEQWAGCDPHAMAHKQSDAAIQNAFEAAKSDILELHAENLILKQWVTECRDQLLRPLSLVDLDEPEISLDEFSQTADLLGGSTVGLLANK